MNFLPVLSDTLTQHGFNHGYSVLAQTIIVGNMRVTQGDNCFVLVHNSGIKFYPRSVAEAMNIINIYF